MVRIIIGCLLLMVMGGFAFALTLGGETSEHDARLVPATGNSSEVADLQRAVGQLQRDLAAQKSAARSLAAATAPPERTDEPNVPVAAEVDEPPRGEAELRFEFEQLPADSQLARQTRGEVETVLEGNEALRSAVRRIECRGSTCRLDLEMPSDAQPQDITKHLLAMNWKGAIMGGLSEDHEPGGPIKGTAFLAEAGSKFVGP